MPPQPTQLTQLYFSPRHLRQRWGFHEESIRRMIRDGRISAIQIGNRLRVHASEVQRVEETDSFAMSKEASNAKIASNNNMTSPFQKSPPTPSTEDTINSAFIHLFNEVAAQVNETARSKGWYENDDQLVKVQMPDHLRAYINKCQRGTRIALIHSEISEGLEGDRKDLQDDKIPEFSAMAAELADAIIRIMDFAHENKIPVAEALVAKAAFNKGRPYKHGNKIF